MGCNYWTEKTTFSCLFFDPSFSSHHKLKCLHHHLYQESWQNDLFLDVIMVLVILNLEGTQIIYFLPWSYQGRLCTTKEERYQKQLFICLGLTMHHNHHHHRLIWPTQCCTQFKSFGNKTFCSKYFHVI